jgi:hypothetical protein
MAAVPNLTRTGSLMVSSTQAAAVSGGRQEIKDVLEEHHQRFEYHRDALYDLMDNMTSKRNMITKQQTAATDHSDVSAATATQPFHLLPLAKVQESDDEYDDNIAGRGACPRIAQLDITHGIALIDRVLSHREWYIV